MSTKPNPSSTQPSTGASGPSAPPARPRGTPVIDLRGINKIYGSGATEIHALKDVSFTIDEGEVVTIMGPSGSGKSSMLNLLGAMDAPTSGQIVVDGTDISTLPESKLAGFRRFSIGFVFQSFYLLPNLDVTGNVLAPQIPYGINDEHRARAHELLESVGLEDRGHSKVRELSGGQKQRVAIARALINDPKVILADEPTGNLDSEIGKAIVELLLSFTDRGKTVVIVTHDPRIGAVVEDHPHGRNIWLLDGELSTRPTYDQYCYG